MTEYIIGGTIQPDGSLTLDHPAELPAGRVTVVLRSDAEPVTPKIEHPGVVALREYWERQRATGHHPPSAEEAEARIRDNKESWKRSGAAAERAREECRLAREEQS